MTTNQMVNTGVAAGSGGLIFGLSTGQIQGMIGIVTGILMLLAGILYLLMQFRKFRNEHRIAKKEIDAKDADIHASRAEAEYWKSKTQKND